jgi:pimeloyl-ACP methyl ester carboxylesterase
MTVSEMPHHVNFESPTSEDREVVYLLHGFGAMPLIMTRLSRCLQRNNYVIRNWGYRSIRKTVAFHAEELRNEVYRVAEEGEFTRLHFVTHSLGSIVVRHALCESMLPLVSRIVMLAPPNGGSHVARAGSLVLGRLCPVLRELSDKSGSFVNRLGEPAQVEIGVIAASNDWVVLRRNTHLKSERDHIVVRGDHLRLPLLRTCAEQTLQFLKTGVFLHTPGPKRRILARSRFSKRPVATRRAVGGGHRNHLSTEQRFSRVRLCETPIYSKILRRTCIRGSYSSW